jgi:hypothetical protein
MILRFLKVECLTYTVFLPSEHTPYIQQIDDNCGKLFRERIYEKYDAWVSEFSVTEKLTASSVRQKLIQWTSDAALHWNTELAAKIGVILVLFFFSLYLFTSRSSCC